jgi:hypothetical protein
MEFKEWLLYEESDMNFLKHPDGFEFTYRTPGVQGSIYAKRDSDNPDIYRVNRVWVKPEGEGYGKKLYMAALGEVTKNGGLLAPAKNSTSDSASNVWRSLYASGEVLKTPLNYKDWPITGRNNRMMSKYPNLRFSDPNTHPPRKDSEFWTFNSGYRLGSAATKATTAPQMVRRQWPTLTKSNASSEEDRLSGADGIELEDL